MTSLQGLPPLPASLQSLLHSGNTSWKEMDRINQMKTLIQQEYSTDANHVGSQSNLIDKQNGVTTAAVQNGDDGVSCKNSRKTFKVTPHNIQSAIAHLQQEMLRLRQLDVSLLYQLWGLNELLQDVKAMREERPIDCISECSTYSLDQSDDRIDEEEDQDNDEHIYENTPGQHDRYVNQFFHRDATMNNVDDDVYHQYQDEDIYEPVYLQPLPSGPPPPVPSKPTPRSIPAHVKPTHTTYESNC